MRSLKGVVVAGVLVAVGVVAWETRPGPWLVTAGVAVVALMLMDAARARVLQRVAILGVTLTGLAVWFAGWVPESTPGRDVWPWGLVLGLPLLLGAALAGSRRHGGSAGVIGRWSRRSRRNGGVASRWQIYRVASRAAMRRKAKVLKPSVRALRPWQRRRTPVEEYATPIARVGSQRIWSPCEDVTTRFGGPRSGKTGELACRILDAPGAVIATSTRTDLITLTAKLRERRGPVYVFNPSGMGQLPSSIQFNPLAGCDNAVTATHRGADLLPADGGDADREHWVSQARRVLAALLHAAALGELEMREVQGWLAEPEASADEVLRLLRRSPEPAFVQTAKQFLDTNDRTRSSITTTIMPALAWLADPNATAAATGGTFDVGRLLDERGTVYMLGAEEGHVAPLVAALTAHIAREARRIAGGCVDGRLDPALTLVLDEAALVCPIPLDVWTADMGGRNVTIHIGAQSRAQLRKRWGDTGCGEIMTNSATVLVLAGSRDADDLRAYSLLTGERDEDTNSFDADGRVTGWSPRSVPVLSPGQIAQLPALRAVIIRRGMPVAIGKLQMAWKRADVKQQRRSEKYGDLYDRWIEFRENATSKLAAAIDTAAIRIEPLLERLSRTSTDTPVDRHAPTVRPVEHSHTGKDWS
ncbi:type IV secretion system protein VirD4 [Amycolatopsis antarctica]|uniref:Type IV secretion system protein VirD4 n=1 Tax=Amycolatopsis antarctica TaxID=1854586 RepID=A0A263D2I0_9PSEU|nr:type IV secretory system conjugative DNA transfer family protein [Amycolatopsis antarctica]OZM72660.1 type IV secretion system protein VirD4 [Amycolatopsis antarctica]